MSVISHIMLSHVISVESVQGTKFNDYIPL